MNQIFEPAGYTPQQSEDGYTTEQSDEEQSPVTTVFDLHHTFVVQHCRFDLFTEPGTEDSLFAVRDRFDPSAPLIYQPNVIQNAHRVNQAETTFRTTTEANIGEAERWGGPSHMPNDDENFRSDVLSLSYCRGKTTLKFATYLRSDALDREAEESYYIRIRRTTELWDRDGNTTTNNVSEYTIEYQVWVDNLLPQSREIPCLLIMDDLMDRRTDHAARHCRYQLESNFHPRHMIDNDWPLRSEIRVEDNVTSLVSQVLSLEALRNHVERDADFAALPVYEKNIRYRCYSCMEDLRDEARCEVVVRLNICSHISCKECMTAWLQHRQAQATEGTAYDAVDRMTCGQCQGQVFSGEIEERLRLGLDQNGEYQPDLRYSLWENRERSLADLDKNTPNELFEKPPMRTDAGLLGEIFRDLYNHARDEPEYSIRPDMNPANFNEMELVYNTVHKTLAARNGQLDNINILYNALLNDVHKAFIEKFRTSKIAKILLPDDYNLALWGFEADTSEIEDETWIDWHPAFWPFVKRLLRRTATFGWLRTCECGDGELHLHGLCRAYYNPKARR